MGGYKAKVTFEIREVDKSTALDMVQRYHYSNTLPRINKHFVGFYLDAELVGLVTLGYGTRPKHTIKKLFPSLDTGDYLEIGRMCMTDEMPRCSESQMLSQLVRWIKANLPEVKVLFTWADGMLGKPGYVYQAANFIYAGYTQTDIYMIDGVKIHPRQTRTLFSKGPDDKRMSCRPTREQMRSFGVQRYRGRQYKYVLFLCGKYEKRRLMAECTNSLTEPPPKDNDLVWQVYDIEDGKWKPSGKPPYSTDIRFTKG